MTNKKGSKTTNRLETDSGLINDLLRDYLESDECDETVRRYLNVSLAENTVRAYRCDVKHFLAWGGSIPAKPELIAKYIAQHGQKHAGSTLSRRLVAIGRAHTAQGLDDPTKSRLVRATLQGVRRLCGSQLKQAAPIQRDLLFQMVRGLKGLRGTRDAALLLIGFAGAFRRSELVSIEVEDLAFAAEGLIVTLRRSKTDQEGVGRQIGIPFVRSRYCPCRALAKWLKVSGIESGPVFRRIDQFQNVLQQALSGQTVSLIIKERIRHLGLDPSNYSGHSLRAGFATAATKSGASMSSVRLQTGHKSDAMLQRYIRDSQLFSGNPNLTIW